MTYTTDITGTDAQLEAIYNDPHRSDDDPLRIAAGRELDRRALRRNKAERQRRGFTPDPHSPAYWGY